MTDEVFGGKSYPDLYAIPQTVDVVQVFRKLQDVPPIVEAAIAIGARVVWMQPGIISEEAAQRARQAGLRVVMDRCLRATHKELTATGMI